jgi:uncharacterized repeat protein (TIGR03803 family)
MIGYKALRQFGVATVAAIVCTASLAAAGAPAGAQFNLIDNFTGGAQGEHQGGSLTRGPDGAFYGTLGSSVVTCGTIYRVRPAEGVSVVHDFADGAEGCGPSGKLLLASDGRLYGLAVRGGIRGYGVLYRFDTNGDYAVVANFADTGIQWALGELMEGQDGLLYGTSYNGGKHGEGTIFSVSKDGQRVNLLHSFKERIGETPIGELLQLPDGSLIGTTIYGGRHGAGVIFKNDRHGGHTVLHHFTGKKDGSHPHSGLTWGSDGRLYGTAVAEGKDNAGVIYRINPDGANFEVVHHGRWPSGAQPHARLVSAPDGQLLGAMALGGGAGDGHGVIFSLTMAGEYRVLVRFDGAEMGGWPNLSVTDAGNGLFYGLTAVGGSHSWGTLFSFTYP